MKLIDALFNISNEFTDGDPTIGTPATYVSADWLNILQAEIANAITASGQTIDQTHMFANDPSMTENNTNQLRDAIRILASGGSSLAPSKVAIVNNQSTALAITGLIFDPTKVDTATLSVSVSIQTSTVEIKAVGTLVISRLYQTSIWDVTFDTRGTVDHGIIFSVNASTGQVSYTSSNVSGTGYVGNFRMGTPKILAQ